MKRRARSVSPPVSATALALALSLATACRPRGDGAPTPRPPEGDGAAAPRAACSDSARAGDARCGDAELGRWIDAYVAAFGKSWGEAYAFSGYLAVLRDGDFVFGKGYGKANRETGAVADRDTRFRIGSLTKQITAAAVMTLVERGKIALDDPITKHLPESPPAWGKITIHHLLTHTSGIPSYTSNVELMKERDKPKTRAQILAELRGRPLDFEPPGSKFEYSNSGYYLLGVLIEKVSGMTYEAYLKERIFTPAGMRSTGVETSPSEPGSAAGYTVDDGDNVVPAHAADMSIPFAAGALRSTVNDLAAWDRALSAPLSVGTGSPSGGRVGTASPSGGRVGTASPSGGRMLGEKSIARMFTVERGDYAYGFNRTRFAGHDVASHTGRIDGFTSYFARALDVRIAVIALSNNDMFEARKVGGAALEMALSGKRTEPPLERAVVPIEPAFAARVVGEYRLTEESQRELAVKVPKEIIDSAMGLTISLEGDRLFMKPSGQQRVRVFLGVDGALFTKQDPLSLHLSPVAPGAPLVQSITLSQGGMSGRYERRAPPPDASSSPPDTRIQP